MSIQRSEVEHIARLAKLALSDAEVAVLQEELSKILDWIGVLDELDTGGVKPTTHPVDISMRLRSDEAGEPLSVDKVVGNTAESEDGMFRVPRVVEGS